MGIFRHVMSGSGPAGDIWTSTLHTNRFDGNIADAHTSWTGFVNHLFGTGGIGGYFADLTNVTEQVTYQLNPATGIAIAVLRAGVTFNGTGGAGQPAPRDALVVGLRTAFPGPGGRGRMFLPAVETGNLTGTGLIASAARTAIAARFASGINAMNVASTTPGIWNIGLADNVRQFVGVTVGVVQGGQRRRSNKIPNAYIAASVF